MARTREIVYGSKVVFSPKGLRNGEKELVEKLHEHNKDFYPLVIRGIDHKGRIIYSLKDCLGRPVYATIIKSNHTTFDSRWFESVGEEQQTNQSSK